MTAGVLTRMASAQSFLEKMSCTDQDVLELPGGLGGVVDEVGRPAVVDPRGHDLAVVLGPGREHLLLALGAREGRRLLPSHAHAQPPRRAPELLGAGVAQIARQVREVDRRRISHICFIGRSGQPRVQTTGDNMETAKENSHQMHTTTSSHGSPGR